MTYKRKLRYILLLLPLLYTSTYAQQKESVVSISCYVNPQLYLQAGVIVQVSDKEGNISCTGQYVSIKNKSENNFYYKHGTRWVTVRPQGSTIVLVPGANTSSSKSPSILKLNVKYSTDPSGDIDNKIRAIAQMNAQSDRAKAGEQVGNVPNQPNEELDKPAKEAVAVANKPAPRKTSTAPSKTKKEEGKKEAVAKTKPRTVPKGTQANRQPERKLEPKSNTLASANAVGLRIDMGRKNTGLGPNLKHRFNRSLSVDAAILFFEGDVIALEGQFEHNFPVKKAAGLEFYIGIGPQFIFNENENSTRLAPVTGIEYYFPNVPLNFSFDWRPTFHLSNETDVEAGRFGLSLRYSF